MIIPPRKTARRARAYALTYKAYAYLDTQGVRPMTPKEKRAERLRHTIKQLSQAQSDTERRRTLALVPREDRATVRDHFAAYDATLFPAGALIVTLLKEA